jgi:hypothetical protein
VSFAGAWTTKRSHCADREDVNRLEIDRQKLLFWESTCRIASSRAALAEQTIETKCTGEGEKWQETPRCRNGAIIAPIRLAGIL